MVCSEGRIGNSGGEAGVLLRKVRDEKFARLMMAIIENDCLL